MRPGRLSLLLFLAVLMAQETEVLYDWTGQFGYTIRQGAIVWNRDWEAGALLLDGSLCSFPRRYGPDLAKAMKLVQPEGRQPFTGPDTTRTLTTLRNDRGDYNLDNLSVTLLRETPRTRGGLIGFKRVYAGPYGQYSLPSGVPLQQSYFLDYLGAGPRDTTELSWGRWLGAAALPDTGSSGSYREWINAGGVAWRSAAGRRQWSSRLSIWDGRQFADVSYASGSRHFHLSRVHGEVGWNRPAGGWGSGLTVGWDLWHPQWEHRRVGTIHRFQTWLTVLRRESLHLGLGATLLDNQSTWLTHGSWQGGWRRWQTRLSWGSEFRPGFERTHQHWFPARWWWGTLQLERNSPSTGVSLWLTGSALEGLWEDLQTVLPYPRSVEWGFRLRGEGSWLQGDWEMQGYLPHSDLGPGYRILLHPRLTFRAHLFRAHGEGTLVLEARGYVGRRTELEFNPILNQPELTRYPDLSRRDPLWIPAVAAQFKVSTFTLTWSVQNALAALSGVRPGVTNIRWYSPFYPQGRLVTITIDWQLND